jgi:hypothetical protein
MAQRRSLAWTELRVGILVIASFLLLALAIFYVSGESGFLISKYKITCYFASANGLRKGGEVWLEGVTAGNVESVVISRQSDPNKAVEVEIKLDKKYQNIVRSDSQVTIETKGLLGDNIVEITRGSAAGQVIQDGVLQGGDTGDIRSSPEPAASRQPDRNMSEPLKMAEVNRKVRELGNSEAILPSTTMPMPPWLKPKPWFTTRAPATEPLDC